MLDLESLFKLSYGMCIISSQKDGKINGCIVNTVFQITPEPPMMVVSLNKNCLTWEYITSSRTFAVSILSEQAPVSFIGKFGFRTGREINKFEQVNFKKGLTGSPIVLDHTAGFLEAEVVKSLDVISHTLFIAKVLACQILDENAIPMTYSYYRDIKGGKTPRTAATYINAKPLGKTKERTKAMKKYKCTICDYIYDPAAGDSENGIKAGTAFEELPDDWVCPKCGASKDDFEPVED